MCCALFNRSVKIHCSFLHSPLRLRPTVGISEVVYAPQRAPTVYMVYGAIIGCPFKNPADCPFQTVDGGHACFGVNAHVGDRPRAKAGPLLAAAEVPAHPDTVPVDIHRPAAAAEQAMTDVSPAVWKEMARLRDELDRVTGRLEGKETEVRVMEGEIQDLKRQAQMAAPRPLVQPDQQWMEVVVDGARNALQPLTALKEFRADGTLQSSVCPQQSEEGGGPDYQTVHSF